MRSFLLSIFLLVALLASAGRVEAFEPWNQRLYPGAPNGTTPMVQRVAATSTATWAYQDSIGWNGVEGVISRALDTGSSDPESLGNAYNSKLARDGRGQVTIRRALSGEAPDFVAYLVSSAVVSAKCNGEWATACVYLFNPLPVPSYFKAAAMMVWAERDAKAVFRHEFNHPFTRSCDQYPGGCPSASDGTWASSVYCTGNPDTLMDCGGAARTAMEFDYETLLIAYPVGTAFLQITPCSDPCWKDGEGGYRWRFNNGWSCDWVDYCLWYDPFNIKRWGPCEADRCYYWPSTDWVWGHIYDPETRQHMDPPYAK